MLDLRLWGLFYLFSNPTPLDRKKKRKKKRGWNLYLQREALEAEKKSEIRWRSRWACWAESVDNRRPSQELPLHYQLILTHKALYETTTIITQSITDSSLPFLSLTHVPFSLLKALAPTFRTFQILSLSLYFHFFQFWNKLLLGFFRPLLSSIWLHHSIPTRYVCFLFSIFSFCFHFPLWQHSWPEIVLRLEFR